MQNVVHAQTFLFLICSFSARHMFHLWSLCCLKQNFHIYSMRFLCQLIHVSSENKCISVLPLCVLCISMFFFSMFICVQVCAQVFLQRKQPSHCHCSSNAITLVFLNSLFHELERSSWSARGGEWGWALRDPTTLGRITNSCHNIWIFLSVLGTKLSPSCLCNNHVILSCLSTLQSFTSKSCLKC